MVRQILLLYLIAAGHLKKRQVKHKNFESLPMQRGMYYPKPMTAMFENLFEFVAIFYSGQSNLKFECIGELETEFENFLGYM